MRSSLRTVFPFFHSKTVSCAPLFGPSFPLFTRRRSHALLSSDRLSHFSLEDGLMRSSLRTVFPFFHSKTVRKLFFMQSSHNFNFRFKIQAILTKKTYETIKNEWRHAPFAFIFILFFFHL